MSKSDQSDDQDKEKQVKSQLPEQEEKMQSMINDKIINDINDQTNPIKDFEENVVLKLIPILQINFDQLRI